MSWKFDPVTFDGTSLTASPFRIAYFEWADAAMSKLRRRPVPLDNPGDYSFPSTARSQFGSAYATLGFELSVWDKTNLNTIRRVFDRFKGDVTLVVNDSDGLGWQTTVRVEELIEKSANRFEARLYIARPIWERTANTTDGPRAIAATPTSFDLNSGGVVRAYPEFTFDPSSMKAATDDYRKRWQISIAWRSELRGEDHEGNGYAIDIANDSLDTLAEVAAGRMQADGDDLAVLVDGELYGRVLDGINTTTTKVWVPIYFAPMKAVSLAVASGAGTPATGGNWDVSTGESLDADDWPAQGSFMVGTERVWYGRRTNTQFQLIKRGYANTTAAAHAAGDIGYWVEHDIQILSNWSSAPTPTNLPSFAHSTALSTNLQHTYNQWVRGTAAVPRHSQPLLRYTSDNIKSPVMSLQPTAAVLTMFDRAPGAEYLPYNNVEFYVPCGVKAAASALAFNLSNNSGTIPGSDVAITVRAFGVDMGGVEQLLGTYGKLHRTGALTYTPDAPLQRIRFNHLFNVITGAMWVPDPTAIAANQVVGVATDALAQRLTFAQPCAVHQWAIYAKESAGADTAIPELALVKPTGGNLNAPILYWFAAIPNAKFTTTYAWAETVLTVPIFVPAGTDWYLTVHEQPALAGAIHWAKFYSIYAAGEALVETASAWDTQEEYDFGFLAIGDGSIVQPDAPSGMGGQVRLDDVVITFDDATPRTPLIVRSAQEDIYPLRARVEHVDLGFYFDLFHVLRLDETLKVRTKTKEVIIDESLGLYAPWAIAPSDPEEWFYLRGTGTATDNTIRYTETGVTGLGLTTVWADAWA